MSSGLAAMARSRPGVTVRPRMMFAVVCDDEADEFDRGILGDKVLNGGEG